MDRSSAPVDARARRRTGKRRGIALLVSLLVGTLLAVIPASPASAIQTIGWTTAPPSTATVGSTVSFAWSGTANTFLGARIQGCFANFSDGANYSNAFQGNFTTGNCIYQNRLITSSPTYQITVGFNLSTGATMSMSWIINTSAPTPTVTIAPPSSLTVTQPGGAVMPTISAYGSDTQYGTYNASCSPAAGTIVSAPSVDVTCTATNGAGKTGTASATIPIIKGTPTASWNLSSSYPAGTRWSDLMTASISTPGLTGSWFYFDANGDPLLADGVIPVGSNLSFKAGFGPSGSSATNWNSLVVTRTFSIFPTSQNVVFTGGQTSATYGDAPFEVRAQGTGGGGQVTITAQAGSPCSVTSSSGTTVVTAMVAISGTGPCVLNANQAASGYYLAAPQSSYVVGISTKSAGVAWSPPSTLTYGQNLASVLTATGSAPGPINYTLANGTVVGSGTVLDAGTYQLTATLLANPTLYTTYPQTVTLTVKKAPVALSVAPIAPTTYGSVSGVPVVPTSNSNGTILYQTTSPTICTISNTGVVSLLRAGQCEVILNQAPTTNFLAGTSSVTFSITKATPGISWANPSDITYGTALGAAQLNGTLDTSSAPFGIAAMGDLTFTVGSGLPADGNVLDAGDHTITATWTPFSGWANQYETVTTTVTIRVDKAFATIDFAWPADITYGTPISADQLQATVAGATGTIVYTVDGSETPALGQVLDAGEHFLSATFTPDVLSEANYYGGVQGALLVVNQAGQEITVGSVGNHTFGDDPFTVPATGGGSGNPVTFTVADSSNACTVEGATVTITGAGSCLLISAQAGNDNYLPAPSGTIGVSIDRAAPKLTWATPHGITFGATLGSAQLDAVVAPAGATGQIHYYLADGVTPADGALLHAGDDQTLVATYEPDANAAGNFIPVSTSVEIDVAQAAQVINLGQLPMKTYGDADFPIIAAGGGSGLPVTYTAVGPCAVNGSTVHIFGAGPCQISADQAGNADYLAAGTQTRQLVVQRAPQTLGVAAIGDRTYGDAAFDVDVTPGPSTNPALVSAVGDCTIAGTTVSITGAGSCDVVGTQAGDSNYLPASSVTRSFGIAKAGQAITFAPLGTANFADGSLEAQASGGASGNPVTFTATGDACGVVGTTVSIQHAGTCEVTAQQDGARNYAAADGVTRTLTVTPQQLSLAWSPSGLTFGDPIGAGQLNATVTPAVPGTWSYSVQAGDVLDAGTHGIHAAFTPAAAGDILPASADVTVVVDKANQTITFGQIAAHTFGDAPFGVTATGGASGQPVTFGATTDGCTATAAGTVTITAAADCTIAADQAGTGNFNAAPTVARSFGVGKGTPTISWTTPGATTYGAPLGDAQLSATASFNGHAVVGTFTYSPAAGEVLHASTTPQQLAVTFVPTNTRDFTGATGSTTIVVNRAAQSVDLPAIPNHTYGDAPFGISATGGASGQPVTLTASGDCTVAGSAVTVVAAGACTITADQAGTSDHLAAPPVSTSFFINQKMGSVTLTGITNHTYGDAPFSIGVTPGPSSGAVVLGAFGACVVSLTGQVSINAAGQCSVTAAQHGDQNYTDASATQVFNVAKAAQTLTFGTLADRSYGDAAFALTATPGASGTPVTFSATGTACTVAGSTVTVVAGGTCTITANQAGTANYLAATPVARTLTVKAGTLTITAQAANRAYGQANPTFTYAVTGYVGGDTAATITTAPTCTTTATATSPSGTYPVTCAGAVSPKYSFAYKAGTLTVGKAATRLQITSPGFAPAGTTTVSATLTDALTGVAINGEPILLTGDLSLKTGTSSPATATFSFPSGLHVIGAVYFGDENHWPAIDAQVLVSYQKTNFVIWGGNTGGLKTGDDYTFYGSQWSKQVKQGTNGAGSSFKGYAASVNAAGTTWAATPSTASPSSVGDIISVLVTTSTAKSGNNLSGNVTKQVLLHVHNADDYRSNGNVTMTGELLTTL